MEVTDDIVVEYRLSWEMPKVDQAVQLESRYGKSVWAKLSEEEWKKLTWEVTSRTSTDLADIADQRAQLELWAATKDQPIQNVVFERRAMHVERWEPVL
jgi:hypothetical protein